MKLITKWVLVLSVAVAGAVSIPAGQVAANRTNEYSPQKLASWRAKGPDGLAQFVALHQKELDKNTLNPPKDDPQWKQLCAAIDVIGGQKDNYASRLYWFTDFNKAKVLSKAEHKPILSLRLLGNLTDELSCANSRFFRTALYPNAKINALLRNKFVLYWSSERPVPVVTIDMGDGRKIKRTLTGNSAHYILDSDGAPLDVLPGLNAPGVFESWLKSSIQLYTDYEANPESKRANYLADYHQQAQKNSIAKLRPVGTAGGLEDLMKSLKKNNPLFSPAPKNISALSAAPLAVTKSVMEVSTLKRIQIPSNNVPYKISSILDMQPSVLYFPIAKLDANSIALIRAKNPPLNMDSNLSQQQAFNQLIQKFERTLVNDTVMNESLHTSIHALFAEGKQGTFEELNRKIYDRLFLTPQSDQWLGLDTPGIYTGIANGGIIKNK